jgi:hypothetical protein
MIAEPITIDRPRSTKPRRTKAEIAEVRGAIYRFAEAQRPVSIRQAFYGMVVQGLIEKRESEYRATVGRLMREMRRSGELPYGWIGDASRWMHKRPSYLTLDAALEHAAASYRKAVWDDQDVLVQVWIEKEALASVVFQETDPWDVPLYVVKGFSSMTYLYGAAEDVKDAGKPVYVYYFGDFDPSGMDIERVIEKDLRGFGLDGLLTFERMSVTESQIARWGLPTRPPKASDSRAKHWGNKPCVELDALRPADLRRLVRLCIDNHIDKDRLAALKLVEAEEREKFKRLIEGTSER